MACLGFAVVVAERGLPASSLCLHSSCQGCELHPRSRAGQGALWSLILAGFYLKFQSYAKNYSSRMKDPCLGLSTSLLSIYDASRLVAVRITAGRCSQKTTMAFSPEHFCQTHSTCHALGSKPQKPALRESKELGSNLRSTSS